MLYYLKSVCIWLFFYSTINLTACNSTPKKSDDSPKIVGGHIADLSKYPHQVSIQVHYRHYCGGSLISDRYILTAGHCSKWKPGVYSVVLGAPNLNANSTYRTRRKVKKMITHDKYCTLSRGDIINDISIWELDKPVKFNEHMKPIKLPSENEKLTPGEVIQVTGYEGVASKTLQAVDVQVIDQKYCQNFYKSKGYQVDDTTICAGLPQGGKSSCQGDSGGPLTARNQLYGIVSWGMGCGRPNTPIVNTFVPKFRSFIKKHTGV